jgi:hypothetical protein
LDFVGWGKNIMELGKPSHNGLFEHIINHPTIVE